MTRDLVFISYSHEDENWLRRLQVFLKPFAREGLRIWVDRGLVAGDQWRTEIEDALRRSRVGVILLSQHLLSSDFITDTELPKLFAAAAAKEIRLIVVPVGAWLIPSGSPLELLTGYQWPLSRETVLERLSDSDTNAALVIVTSAIAAAAAVERDASRVVRPDAPVESASPLSLPQHQSLGALNGVPSLPPHIVARGVVVDNLRRTILSVESGGRIGVWGRGGMGKTVLAQMVVHDADVRRAFPDGVYWVSVGQQPNVAVLQSVLARWGGATELISETATGKGVLSRTFANKSCLIVLDDVWDMRHALELDLSSPTSRMLVTTRDGQILTALGAAEFAPDPLDVTQSMALLASWAGTTVEALPSEAREVIEHVEFLPLALSIIGANVKDGLSWTDALRLLKIGHLEFLDHPSGSVFNSLRLSTDHLSATERARYFECAVFPEDEEIPEAAVWRLWHETGAIQEEAAKVLLVRLARRSLLERSAKDGEVVIYFHDLQQDFLRLNAPDLPRLHGTLLTAYRALLPSAAQPDWPALPAAETYFWKWLAYHLAGAGLLDQLRDLLSHPSWIERKIRSGGMADLLADYKYAGGDPGLERIRDTLELSAHILADDPEQCGSQLWGRLAGDPNPRIATALQRAIDGSSGPWLRPIRVSLIRPGGALRRTLAGHDAAVTAVALSADGTRAISLSQDKRVFVWDLLKNKTIRRRPLDKHVDAIALNRDGTRAVLVREGDALTWDLRGDGSDDSVGTAGPSAVISADAERIVFVANGDVLTTWDVNRGLAVHAIAAPIAGLTVLALSADGRVATAIQAGTLFAEAGLETETETETTPAETPGRADVHLIDLTNGASLTVLTDVQTRISAISSGPDGIDVVWLGDDHGELSIRRVSRDRNAQRTLQGDDDIQALALARDGRHAVSGSRTGTLSIWDFTRNAIVRTLTGHSGPITAVALSGDGTRAASASRDRTVKIWDLSRGLGSADDTVGIKAVALDATGTRAVVVGRDGSVRLWDDLARTGPKILEHSRPARVVALSADGRLAVSAIDRTVSVWDLATNLVSDFAAHDHWITAVALTADGTRAITGSADDTVKIWDVATRTELFTLYGHTGTISAVAWSGDGTRALSACDDGLVRIWNMESRKPMHKFTRHPFSITAAALSADGTTAVFASEEGRLTVRDLTRQDGEPLTLEGHTGSVTAVALSADGRLALSAATDMTVRGWDLPAGSCFTTFTAETPLLCCAMAPSGVVVAGGPQSAPHVLVVEHR